MGAGAGGTHRRQVLTIQPGGFTGWHTLPGPTFVAVAQGTPHPRPKLSSSIAQQCFERREAPLRGAPVV
jgi:hypothetical protein